MLLQPPDAERFGCLQSALLNPGDRCNAPDGKRLKCLDCWLLCDEIGVALRRAGLDHSGPLLTC